MKMLVEFADTDALEYVTESHEDKKEKQYFIKGPFAAADRKNRNSRTYQPKVLKREVERYNEEFVKTKRAVSRLDHPLTSQVLLKDACHLITKLEYNDSDNVVYGEARMLDTPDGKIAKILMDEGVRLAVSTRGLGSLHEGGIVGDDFRLLAIDLVSNPSCDLSMVEAMIRENVEYIIDGSGNIVEMAVESLEKNLAKHGSRQLAEDLSNFISQLKTKL